MARVGIGGVSQIPLRLTNVEVALEGQASTQKTLEVASQVAVEGAKPLPQAAWKVSFLKGALLSTLELALED